MQRSLVLVGEGGGEELMIDEDGVHAVEQFALAKYYMTANVYRHRVRLISDQMISRAIRLGIERDQVPELIGLYTYDGKPEFIRNYQLWDDGRFMETFCPRHRAPPGDFSGRMIRRLRERRLLKRVFSARVESLDARVREIVLKEFGKKSRDHLRAQIEGEVAECLRKHLPEPDGQGVEEEFVISHVFGIKSVRESSRNEDAEILVNKGDTPRAFSDESRLFGSINEAFADNHIEIYAPIEWPNPSQKDSLRANLEPAIRDIIERQCRNAKRNSK